MDKPQTSPIDKLFEAAAPESSETSIEKGLVRKLSFTGRSQSRLRPG